MVIEDITGKPMKALDVFSLCIKALKTHLETELKKHLLGIESSDIRWVLTVPAMWSENAKQFMRRSAEKVKHILCMICPSALGIIFNLAK